MIDVRGSRCESPSPVAVHAASIPPTKRPAVNAQPNHRCGRVGMVAGCGARFQIFWIACTGSAGQWGLNLAQQARSQSKGGLGNKMPQPLSAMPDLRIVALVGRALAHEVVLYIGAGVSIGSGLPSGAKLAELVYAKASAGGVDVTGISSYQPARRCRCCGGCQWWRPSRDPGDRPRRC